MRDKIKVLYYPDMQVSETTLKKCILFFDEIHFMDRPALTIGNFGLIGAQSPLRAIEQSFREDAGVPLYVHSVDGGRLSTDIMEKVVSDLSDASFIENYRDGLSKSKTFRNQQFPEGDYGSFGNTQKELIKLFENIDLSRLDNSNTVEFLKQNFSPFDITNPDAVNAFLLQRIALCSAQLNFSLMKGARSGFIPLADATPYVNLLNTQYKRAAKNLENSDTIVSIADLGFAIFDELISNESIESMDIRKVVEYRKKSENAREEFLEYLASIQVKQASLLTHENYLQGITTLIKTEITPAVTNFRKRLETINEGFTSSLLKGGIEGAAVFSGIHIFADITWLQIVALVGASSRYVLKAAVDNYFAARALRRESSISYLLSLDEHMQKFQHKRDIIAE
ncbi:MAG: hypothetical protein QM652_14105 [Legionella sp.]|uniref:hypothetical protein n=1 Tax=Legionella sp. TaxID=459 RepID=UPI0039E64706